jgi:hypothetical protein
MGWGPPEGPLTHPHSSYVSYLPDLAALNLNSGSSGASDQDTLAPLPHPPAPWPLGQGYPYQYPGPPPCFPPAYQDPGFSYGSGSAGSQQSEGESLASPTCAACSLALPCPAAAPCTPAVCLGPGRPPPGSWHGGTGSWHVGTHLD